MKLHLRNPNNHGGQACVKRFSAANAQDYGVYEEDYFIKLMIRQPETICKKCAAIINNKLNAEKGHNQ